MIDNMFYIPFVHLQVNDWDNKKSQLLYLYSKISNKVEFYSDGVNKVNTNFFNDCLSQIKNIEDIFNDEIKEFCSQLNINSSQCFVGNSWFELSVKNSYHSIHNHGPIGYSSVCFINYDEKFHEPTKFIAPFLNFLTGATLQYDPIDIKEGSIIFFPAAINHFTLPNSSDLERLIVSFNLWVK